MNRKTRISRNGCAIVAALVALAALWAPVRPARAQIPLDRAPHFLWFDLDMALGVGTDLSRRTADKANVLATFRSGVAIVAPLWIVTAAGIVRVLDRGELHQVGFGLQVESVHVPTGLSGYGGPYANLDGTSGFSLGFGWSVLSVELDIVSDRRAVRARWFVKLRVPISVGLYALWQHVRLKAALRK